MTGLYSGEILVTRFLRAVRQSTSNKIISTLLDGSDHVQVIGSNVNRLQVNILVDTSGKDTIDAIDATGGLLTIHDEFGEVFDGRILNKTEWSKMVRGFYEASLTMSIEAVV